MPHAGVNAPDLIDFITTLAGLKVTTEELQDWNSTCCYFQCRRRKLDTVAGTRHRHMRYEMKEPQSG